MCEITIKMKGFIKVGNEITCRRPKKKKKTEENKMVKCERNDRGDFINRIRHKATDVADRGDGPARYCILSCKSFLLSTKHYVRAPTQTGHTVSNNLVAKS